MPLDLSGLPRFTLAERDRRWGRVRQLMGEAGCDCIVAPGMRDLEEQATSRYLSQIGGVGYSAWVVFPLDGEPTAVVDSERNREFAVRAQDWITDVRVGSEVEAVPARLQELGLQRARIGLTQFRGHYREPLGNIPHDVVVGLQSALPSATFYGENDVLTRARMVKSREEVGVIQEVTAANEEAIAVMCETARPGVRQEDVWYAMCDVMVRASGGWPARLSVAFGGSANSTLGMPIPDRIADGALCSQEICSRIQGYRAQCNHTIQVGPAGPRDYKDAMLATIEVYNELVAWVQPGRTIRELCEHYLALCRARDAEDSSGVVLHTNGLGNDYPRLGPRLMASEDADIVLVEGHTFTLKPVLRFPSGTATQYGDPLTITPEGGVRLGRRDQQPIIVG